MQVVQTAAPPPNQGRISRAMSGCTRNSNSEDSAMTSACSIGWLFDVFAVRLALHPAAELAP
ncbi:MAG: hypothetical protein O2979_11640 [Proteobacteria bacterium]|nr:hypothetical protein [Pseudomonadota bacterium]